MPLNNKTKTATKSVAKKAEAGKKPAAKKVPVKTAKKETQEQAGAGAEVEAVEETKSSTRYFKIVGEDGSTHGRFSGKKPKQAANKALTSLLKEKKAANKDVKGVINFSIVECTRGSKHKTYDYEGQRKKLPERMTVTIDDKKIVYEFSNSVKKAPKVAVPLAAEGGAKKAAATKTAVASKTVPKKAVAKRAAKGGAKPAVVEKSA